MAKKKDEGPDEFSQTVASGAEEPVTTNVDDEVKAMGISTTPLKTPGNGQGGNR